MYLDKGPYFAARQKAKLMTPPDTKLLVVLGLNPTYVDVVEKWRESKFISFRTPSGHEPQPLWQKVKILLGSRDGAGESLYIEQTLMM